MGLHISASGILNALRRQDITANNVANARSTGFRASRANSSEAPGGGVRLGGVTRDLSPGALESTGRPLDVATTEGYFRVETPDGRTAFTRDGSFGLNANGEVVTSDGARLSPPVQVPAGATSISVSRRGEVFATAPGALEPQRVGRIEVFTFQNPGALESVGGNLYHAPPAAGAAQPVSSSARFLPGTLESSNVNLATEQVNTLLNLQMAKANANAFRVQDETLGTLIDITR